MTITDNYRPDPDLQKHATHSADLCVKFIRHKFGREADYSEAFIPEVENILQLLHLSMASERPSDDDIGFFCNMFGSYLGETYRRHRGGEWGTSDGNTPTLCFGSGYKSYPWARVYKRLINGEEDNVHVWYLGMIQYADGGPSLSPTPPPLPTEPSVLSQPKTRTTLPKKRGLLSKFFGI